MLNKLKSEKGITLISLIVYVTVMLIVITIVGTITSYFYANVNDMYKESKDENGESTLDMYLTKDLKNKEIIIKTGELEDIPNEGTQTINLQYENGESVTYTIVIDNENDDKNFSGIYRNQVKIYNIEVGKDMKFKIQELSEIAGSIELQLLKDNSVFKSFIVNVKTTAEYPTN